MMPIENIGLNPIQLITIAGLILTIGSLWTRMEKSITALKVQINNIKEKYEELKKELHETCTLNRDDHAKILDKIEKLTELILKK